MRYYSQFNSENSAHRLTDLSLYYTNLMQNNEVDRSSKQFFKDCFWGDKNKNTQADKIRSDQLCKAFSDGS